LFTGVTDVPTGFLFAGVTLPAILAASVPSPYSTCRSTTAAILTVLADDGRTTEALRIPAGVIIGPD
jgi:hypothetical protein